MLSYRRMIVLVRASFSTATAISKETEQVALVRFSNVTACEESIGQTLRRRIRLRSLTGDSGSSPSPLTVKASHGQLIRNCWGDIGARKSLLDRNELTLQSRYKISRSNQRFGFGYNRLLPWGFSLISQTLVLLPHDINNDKASSESPPSENRPLTRDRS